jgi:hypothetical protein
MQPQALPGASRGTCTEFVEVRPVDRRAEDEEYQYTPLADPDIRLLRISPGSFESPMLCSLKCMPLAKLEASLVLRASSFDVSDIRDIVYALLHLTNDAGASPQSESIASEDVTLTADYTRHAVDVFTNFVRYCIDKSGSLDIICQPWAMWPPPDHDNPYLHRTLPTWVGVASFGEHGSAQWHPSSGGLLGSIHGQRYNASRTAQMLASLQGTVLQADRVY